jgi:hypothetical protein
MGRHHALITELRKALLPPLPWAGMGWWSRHIGHGWLASSIAGMVLMIACERVYCVLLSGSSENTLGYLSILAELRGNGAIVGFGIT